MRAFSSCEKLESVILSKSLKIIDRYAFEHCSSLSAIIIPDSVESLGWYAFNECYSLQSVVLSNSLTSIPIGTFQRTRITHLLLPASVTKLDEGAFSNCTHLKTISFEGIEDPEAGALVFDNCPISQVFVPKEYEGNTFIGLPVTKGDELYMESYTDHAYIIMFVVCSVIIICFESGLAYAGRPQSTAK